MGASITRQEFALQIQMQKAKPYYLSEDEIKKIMIIPFLYDQFYKNRKYYITNLIFWFIGISSLYGGFSYLYRETTPLILNVAGISFIIGMWFMVPFLYFKSKISTNNKIHKIEDDLDLIVMTDKDTVDKNVMLLGMVIPSHIAKSYGIIYYDFVQAAFRENPFKIHIDPKTGLMDIEEYKSALTGRNFFIIFSSRDKAVEFKLTYM